jgi:LPS-assembly lipoprotein
MSSFEPKKTPAQVGLDRRAALRALATLLVGGPALSACTGGFQPLYGSLGGGGSTEEKLAQVEVSTIPGRVGQRIRNELIFQQTGGGTPLPPVYRLEITIREMVTSTLVSRDGNATGQIYQVDAAFQLISLKDKRVVLQGTSHGRAGFERFTSIFSNVQANQEAQNRVARTVATDLKARLSAYLSTAA